MKNCRFVLFGVAITVLVACADQEKSKLQKNPPSINHQLKSSYVAGNCGIDKQPMQAGPINTALYVVTNELISITISENWFVETVELLQLFDQNVSGKFPKMYGEGYIKSDGCIFDDGSGVIIISLKIDICIPKSKDFGLDKCKIKKLEVEKYSVTFDMDKVVNIPFGDFSIVFLASHKEITKESIKNDLVLIKQ